MARIPTNTSSLELTMAIPGLTTSSSEGGCCMKNFDMNQLPSGMEDWPIGVVDDDEESGAPRKKLRLSKEQYRLLEESFRENQTLSLKQKEALALQLKLKPRQVEVWFQNRRARTKLKQTEIECDYLKRWYASLTEENRRLHREVEELRAMRVAPPTVFSPNSCEPMPASTLSMCPRCERVTSSVKADGISSAPAATTTTVRPNSNVALSTRKAPAFHHSSRQSSAAY